MGTILHTNKSEISILTGERDVLEGVKQVLDSQTRGLLAGLASGLSITDALIRFCETNGRSLSDIGHLV